MKSQYESSQNLQRQLLYPNRKVGNHLQISARDKFISI